MLPSAIPAHPRDDFVARERAGFAHPPQFCLWNLAPGFGLPSREGMDYYLRLQDCDVPMNFLSKPVQTKRGLTKEWATT
jgi:hypothetical protein